MPVVAPTWPVWACCAAGLLALTPEARSQDSSPVERPRLIDLYVQAREARLAGDDRAWLERGQRALQLAPDHPDLLISVGRAFATVGRFDDAAAHLEEAVRRGGGFDLETFPEFGQAPDTARLRALGERARRNLDPVAAPEIFLVLQNESLHTEGISWDPVGGHLYVGSLNGEIWRVGPGGALERFAGPGSGLREVLGLKVDAERRLLWAVTGVFPDLIPTGEPKEGAGTTGLHAYSLETGERVRDCGLDERPTLHAFNDMALAKSGDVYVSDSVDHSVYKLSAKGCELERILQDSAMSFPNGIALTRDESRLYVAHVEGISAVDVRTGKRIKLAVPIDAAVNSIDGMVWDGEDLLGIQGNPYLARVVRIRLADDGRSVREVATMSSRPPPGLVLKTGVVVNDQFYMAAEFRDGIAAPGQAQPEPRSHILRTLIR